MADRIHPELGVGADAVVAPDVVVVQAHAVIAPQVEVPVPVRSVAVQVHAVRGRRGEVLAGPNRDRAAAVQRDLRGEAVRQGLHVKV